jgi:hypothetical protein
MQKRESRHNVQYKQAKMHDSRLDRSLPVYSSLFSVFVIRFVHMEDCVQSCLSRPHDQTPNLLDRAGEEARPG